MYAFVPRPTRKSLSLAAALLLSAGLLAGPTSAQDTAPPSDQAQMIADATAAVWWNRTRFIDRLALSEELRQQMDTALAGHLEGADQKARAQQQKVLGQALAAGEWDKALATVDALNTARAEAFSAQTQLKIDVLKMLEPNQRKALAENFPRLLDRPWVRPGRSQKAGGARQRSR